MRQSLFWKQPAPTCGWATPAADRAKSKPAKPLPEFSRTARRFAIAATLPVAQPAFHLEVMMDLKLQFLESFEVVGPDRQPHRVRAYDRLARNEALPGGEHWEATGVVEFRLDDGRLVEALPSGPMRIHGTDVELHRTAAS
jgi:hypothetical protein